MSEEKDDKKMFVMFTFLLENELKKKFEKKCTQSDLTMSQRLRKLIRADVGEVSKCG